MSKNFKYCAPHRADMERATGSCLTHRELVVVAEAYNNSLGSNSRKIPRKLFKNKLLLWQALADGFKAHDCGRDEEHCWLQTVVPHDRAARGIMHESFRPLKPTAWYSNRNEWLNTYDILLVMRQYEKTHKGQFKFVGVFPRDFATLVGSKCVSVEMCDRSLGKKEKRLGFVFNHDLHVEGGSHWVALFCCMDPSDPKYGAYYYDSVAKPPKAEVLAFMNAIKARSPDPGKFALRVNATRHQFGNTECGMFSMHFLISCVDPGNRSKTVDEIVATPSFGSDESLTRMRDELYTPLKRTTADKSAALGGGRSLERRRMGEASASPAAAAAAANLLRPQQQQQQVGGIIVAAAAAASTTASSTSSRRRKKA